MSYPKAADTAEKTPLQTRGENARQAGETANFELKTTERARLTQPARAVRDRSPVTIFKA